MLFQEDSIVIALKNWFMHIDFAKAVRKINKLFSQRNYLDVIITQSKIVFIHGAADPDTVNYGFQRPHGLTAILLGAGINKCRDSELEDIFHSDINHFIECGNAIYCNIDDTECVIDNIKGSFPDDYGFFGREAFFCRVTFSGKFYYLNHEFTGTIAGTYDAKPKSIHREFKEFCPNLTFRLSEKKLDNIFETAINEKVAEMDIDEILRYNQDEDYFNP